MSSVITFENHSPVRIADVEKVETVWDADQDFGHHRIKRYTTKLGKALYWASYNSGQSYGTHSPETTRTYLRDAKAIHDYFAEQDRLSTYHAEVEALVDAAVIVDLD